MVTQKDDLSPSKNSQKKIYNQPLSFINCGLATAAQTLFCFSVIIIRNIMSLSPPLAIQKEHPCIYSNIMSVYVEPLFFSSFSCSPLSGCIVCIMYILKTLMHRYQTLFSPICESIQSLYVETFVNTLGCSSWIQSSRPHEIIPTRLNLPSFRRQIMPPPESPWKYVQTFT